MDAPLTLTASPLTSPEARALIAALDAELTARYPGPVEVYFTLHEHEVSPGQGVFLIAHEGAVAVGCGAIRRLDGTTAELKRMYVVPTARGRGVAGRLLAALEGEARALGVSRLVLETGTRQPEAVALYTRHGYRPIAPFGDYTDPEDSLCFAKALSP